MAAKIGIIIETSKKRHKKVKSEALGRVTDRQRKSQFT